MDKQKKYVIVNAKYKNAENVPVLLDEKDGEYIKSLNKTWKCSNNGMVYFLYEKGPIVHEIYMHEIVMALKMQDKHLKKENKCILHINRIGLDNRRDNLMYDTYNNDINKNMQKKKRIVTLPPNSGISSDELPTYVWYLKPNDSHGERFIVHIGDTKWKTTSSKNISLRYKLEEAKKYLRHLRATQPNIFDEYCMNGEFTKQGKEYMNEYFSIINSRGYNCSKTQMDNITEGYIQENLNGLSDDEIIMLHSKTFM